jgi:hypothetical protein
MLSWDTRSVCLVAVAIQNLFWLLHRVQLQKHWFEIASIVQERQA